MCAKSNNGMFSVMIEVHAHIESCRTVRFINGGRGNAWQCCLMSFNNLVFQVGLNDWWFNEDNLPPQGFFGTCRVCRPFGRLFKSLNIGKWRQSHDVSLKFSVHCLENWFSIFFFLRNWFSNFKIYLIMMLK